MILLYLQVIDVRRFEVLFQVFDLGVQGYPQNVDLFQILRAEEARYK